MLQPNAAVYVYKHLNLFLSRFLSFFFCRRLFLAYAEWARSTTAISIYDTQFNATWLAQFDEIAAREILIFYDGILDTKFHASFEARFRFGEILFN